MVGFVKKVIRKIVNKLDTILKWIPWYWHIATHLKLRFKFNALYHGIKRNLQSIDNLYNFRRNIHRLEKGLSYPVTKKTFATDYILDTVNYLKSGKKEQSFDWETVSWGEAVLKLYFSKVEHRDTVAKAFAIYSSIVNEDVNEKLVPFQGKYKKELSVSYQALHDLAVRRRSVRYFLDKKVEEGLIKKAYEIGKMSPSACNRQSFDLLFYNEKSIVDKLASIPGGVQGYTLPSVIVITGNYSGYFDERDINAPIIDANLAIMPFLFALETLGLGSVCINWPNLPDRERKIREVINIGKHEFVIMMVGIGYPDPEGKIPYSSKRSPEEVIKVNAKIK